MRPCLSTLIVAAAILSASVPATQAGGLAPGYSAHAQLVFANGWARYDAGCLKWMPFVRSWYNICVAGRPRGPVVVAKF
jgi:hypothetical protein